MDPLEGDRAKVSCINSNSFCLRMSRVECIPGRQKNKKNSTSTSTGNVVLVGGWPRRRRYIERGWISFHTQKFIRHSPCCCHWSYRKVLLPLPCHSIPRRGLETDKHTFESYRRHLNIEIRQTSLPAQEVPSPRGQMEMANLFHICESNRKGVGSK